jgi:RNA-directed DNA polymerase
MLATLETGVRGGRWHTLIDKIFAERNLYMAISKVVANEGAAGVDHVSTAEFEARRREELVRLSEALRTDSYRPQAVRRTWIDKPGGKEKRPLGIPTVSDRVVQTALLQVLEPIYDSTFSESSYGFRHGRGCHHALERVEALLNEGYVHVVDADLKSYFDTIPHDRLPARVGEKVSDRRVLRLVKMFLEQGVMEGLSEWTPEAGTPQGAVISPLLANIYLNPLDHVAAEAGFAMVRYADDFVILCKTREDAERALEMVRQWVGENGLTLHPAKTRLVDTRSEAFEFLGYRFRGDLRVPRSKSRAKFKAAVREKTRRTNGHSLRFIVASLTPTLRGWFAYYRHCTPGVYRILDSWIRMRLRSILRHREGRDGRGRGADQARWPNAYLEQHGLFSLHAAHVRLRQSCRRSYH